MKTGTHDNNRLPLNRLNSGEYRFRYLERCLASGNPAGEGDFLSIHGELHTLNIFIPVRNSLQAIFYPKPSPQCQILSAAVRRLLLIDYLTDHSLQILNLKFSVEQIEISSREEERTHCWFSGVTSNLGQIAVCNDDGVEMFALPQQSETIQNNSAITAWRLPGRCRVGQTSLTLHDIGQLVKGDVVMVTRRQQWIVLAMQPVWQWQFEDNGIMIEGDLFEDESDSSSITSTIEQKAVIDNPLGRLRNIELCLEIVLGELLLPLHRATQLKATDFLPLESGGIHAARLRLGSQTIATGELVEIDGRLGIILEQVYYHPSGPGKEQ